ncbi:hypothetical protein R3P38DRAFT_3270974 [Favolaschia claudopus]|uniref:ATP synthase protein MI25 n=1 Tax=Favolaschia claudopus TaxID=2862362 RepID=A0AAW0B7U7_9AGAR
MSDAFSQIQCSLLVGLLSLIPNDGLRYTAVGLAAGVGVIYSLHLKRLSVQHRRLVSGIEETEQVIREAKEFCARDVLSLTEESVKLLEMKRWASIIQCRILDSSGFTWRYYRAVNKDLAEATNKIKKIRTAVQLIMEAERQRKFTEDINATQTVLAIRGSPAMAMVGMSLSYC